ncbi:EamA family transporter [Variovorax sp. RKNM96]|uniref:DMT family transporter n=1 Tax=Variovorax sp. RKNM96 TaxID=2681552 RepID=UPI00197D50AE|nr:DMT family transporter [Variovorax sp. RKNM96]QSI32990.1 EamA family transporter [Variovorax sp. RKNM96]
MQTKLRGALEMSAAMVISGTIGWFVVRFNQPLVDVLFWRCVFGAATLLVACAALGVLRRGLTPRTFALAAFGGVALVVNWLLIFASFSRASISIATAVYNTQPFMLVALGALLFSERLTAMKVAWLCIAFAGVVLVAQAKGGGGADGSAYLTGVLMALGAAFCYAVAAIVAKKLGDMAPHLIALIQVCVGIAMLAPFANLRALPTDAGTWGVHLTMGVIYTGLVFILLYGAIQKLPTTVAGALSFIYPLVAIGVDFVAFGQRLTLAQLVGATTILIAAAGMTFGWTLPGMSGRAPAARKS